MVVGYCQKIVLTHFHQNMGLELDKIKKKIQEKKKAATLNRATVHQNRIKFHAETRIVANISQPVTDFLSWVSALIPHDKFKIFKTLFRYPVKTNELTGIVFDKLSRVFDGRNPAFNYQFLNPEQRDDWEWYRQNVLKEPSIWQTDGWEYFKTEINSVLIVDLAQEQDASDPYPQPYFYWLTIDHIIDYRVNEKTGNMDYIIFRQKDDTIAVLDDSSYRLFSTKNGQIVGEPIVDNAHDLGYCPARFFWNEPLSLRDQEVKAHPLSKMLESLDWFLFFHTSKRHLDLYGAYPIYSGYEQDCNFSNTETGDECDGGFLKNREGNYIITGDGSLCRCPKCGDKRIAGVGSFVEVPVPDTKDDPDLRNPVQILSIDKSSLDYNVEEEERLRNEIINAVVGVDGGAINEQAINELQVNANFENQSTILNRIKKGFEEAQNFVDETVCRLRYGSTFVSANINLGTEFYVLNTQTLRSQYKLAKESGASEAELDALQNQILETEYRHNPTQLQRMLILAELEPYKHFTRDEAINLYEKNLINAEDFIIKINFSNFVRRFERENTNLLEFGVNLPFYRKIEIVTNKFKEYASEHRQRPTN